MKTNFLVIAVLGFLFVSDHGRMTASNLPTQTPLVFVQADQDAARKNSLEVLERFADSQGVALKQRISDFEQGTKALEQQVTSTKKQLKFLINPNPNPNLKPQNQLFYESAYRILDKK